RLFCCRFGGRNCAGQLLIVQLAQESEGEMNTGWINPAQVGQSQRHLANDFAEMALHGFVQFKSNECSGHLAHTSPPTPGPPLRVSWSGAGQTMPLRQRAWRRALSRR